jgi:hypothetical protein
VYPDPCAQQGFFLVAGDAFFQETLAIILSAKATDTPVGFTHVYCHADGYWRESTMSACSERRRVARSLQ